MNVIYIVPGSGGTFYCENCLRDIALIRDFHSAGHNVVTVPLYLPLFRDDPNFTLDTPVFFGAVSSFFRQVFPTFMRAFPFSRKILDSKPLLKLAARLGGAVDARGLEKMTLDMLRHDGADKREIGRLVAYLKRHFDVDLIHISNALLLGVGIALKRAFACPLACSLQDEHVWINALSEPNRTEAWRIMGESARLVDAFFPVSGYYGAFIRNRTGVSDDKFNTVPPGIDPDLYSGHERRAEKPVIGFMARLSDELGLSILVDAYLKLKERRPQLRLFLTGGCGGQDRSLVRRIKRRLSSFIKNGDVRIWKDFSRSHRIRFLKELTLLSVPVPGGEAVGIFLIEAAACGVPVIQPAEGGFPETVAGTRGGILYSPNTADRLAECIGSALEDPEKLESMGSRARLEVRKTFNLAKTVNLLEVHYRRLIEKRESRIVLVKSTSSAGPVKESAKEPAKKATEGGVDFSSENGSLPRRDFPLLRLEGVYKSYPGTDGGPAVGVLKGVDMELEWGRSLAVTGPSGSGKTTLLNLCGTLDFPDSGTVSINGIEPRKMRDNELCVFRNRRISFIFQDFNLLPQCTVYENVLLPFLQRGKRIPPEICKKADDLLGRLGLIHRRDYSPDRLSSGEKQRAAITRSLLSGADLLLADEPTGSLDRANSEKFADLLATLIREEKKAVLLVTHSLGLADRMDRRLELENGVLVQ